MVMHPPAFATQAEEQAKWNEGFMAGMKEVFHELEEIVDYSNLEGPTRQWVEEAKIKITTKFS